jgi:hypothetical protein
VKALIDGHKLQPPTNPKNTDDSKGPVFHPDGGIRVPGLEGGSPAPA